MAFFDKFKSTFAHTFHKMTDDEGLLTPADFVAGRLYAFVMVCVVGLILLLAVACAKQTQHRHDLYTQLAKAQALYHDLKSEEQRLIIEQQTYSSVPIIAKRATNELNMFYPVQKDRIVIAPPKKALPKIVPTPSEPETRQ